MSELTDIYLKEFHDADTRHIYAENFLNTHIATQIKVLREDREWTQSKLAELAGMKQERISILENVNYESWSVKTLKRLAKAFDLRLSIKFESFGSYLTDYDSFSRENLKRPSFDKDAVFHPELATIAVSFAKVAAVGTSTRATFRVIQGTDSEVVQRTLDFDRPRLIASSSTTEENARVITKGGTGTWQKIQKIS